MREIFHKWLLLNSTPTFPTGTSLNENKMENIFELSFAGNISGLRRYIESKMFGCEVCEDKGFIEKTEWSGTDDSYDITIRCNCSYD